LQTPIVAINKAKLASPWPPPQKPASFHLETAARAGLPPRQAEAGIQLGARIPDVQYRQLKLGAVLRGVTVQTLIEHAIQEFLTNHPELLHPKPAQQLPKSTSHKSR
jgi:hypothetical protein